MIPNIQTVKVAFGTGTLLVGSRTNHIILCQMKERSPVGHHFPYGSSPELDIPFSVELHFLSLQGLAVLEETLEACKGRMINEGRRMEAERIYAEDHGA